jgi:predicted phosphate transport protein (TIGR00153 family)
MSRKLFGWFSPKRGDKVLNMVEKHLELTQNAVNNLYIMIETSASFKKEESKTAFLKLSQMEMEADNLRRNMVEELSKGEMFPEERSDLMELVRAVDWIADWSREAGRILEIIPFEKTPDELKDAALAMCKATVSCVKVLVKCVQILNKNPQKALDLANEVEMLEETVDDLYGNTRSIVAYGDFPDFSMGQLILLNEFLDAIETVADWCENTADIVRAVSIRAL